MRDMLILLGLAIPVVVLYWLVLRLARQDMQEREAAGKHNLALWAVLLVPLIGPVLYLLMRKWR